MLRNPSVARRNLFLVSCALLATACEQPAEPTFVAPEGPRMWSQVVGHPYTHAVPGGIAQIAYLTEPTSQDPTSLGMTAIVEDGVAVLCFRGGYGRVHVLTGDDHWHVFDVTCYWEPQGDG